MADDWFFTRNNERQGPVSPAKLKAMVKDGWLLPKDLVWKEGMGQWVAAGKVPGLFSSGAVRKAEAQKAPEPAKPAPAEKAPAPKLRTKLPPKPGVNWHDLAPRHVLAAGGGFIAALGIAFTAISQSQLGLAFTVAGLALTAAGLYVEVGHLLKQASENIGKVSREAADRRLEARKLAVEKQKLDLEAKKLAHKQAAEQQALRGEIVPAPVAHMAQPVPQQVAPSVVVINQAPVRRWSPRVAAVLSFFVPGLGQLYKGQIINGIVWFVFVGVGYLALVLPGLLLHFFCVLGALSGNPWTEAKTTVVRQ